MTTWIIDRFEENLAVCERPDKTFVQISRNLLPSAAKEGDVIRLDADGRYHIDTHLTKLRAERIMKKMNALRKA